MSSVPKVTRWQLALRAAQEPVTARLKPLGFRKAGNYFNRSAADNLVQVVGFQSAQYISILHGNFSVNLGIYVSPIAKLEGNTPRGRNVTDAHCEIRSRLSELANLGADKWWPLDETASTTGKYLADLIETLAVPFLDRYSSYALIRQRFDEDGELPFHNAARSALATAIVCWDAGDVLAARRYFDQARSTPVHNRHFKSHVDEIQEKCGV